MTTERDANTETTATSAVLEAPIVVRLELGSVSMSARNWAELRPGDVIETGQRIAEPVLLRAGDRVLARGELVNVDGELGVRVLELMPR
jgi:flagellar motor switch/type III secretory pathway protein FliN